MDDDDDDDDVGLDKKLVFPYIVENQPKTRRCASVPAVKGLSCNRVDRAMGKQL